MGKRAFAILSVLTVWCGVAWGQGTPSAGKPILAGPLAKLDIKDAKVESVRGKPRGTLNVGLHFGLDPGRKGFPGNRTIVQRIDPRPGGAKALIRLYAVCGGPASYICEPKIETLWARHEASIDTTERDRLSKEMQRILVEEHYLVPLYLQPFVQAVGPRVLPEGAAVQHYWDTVNAPFPWPWEVWEVKG